MRLIEHTPKRWSKFLKTNRPISESIIPIQSKGTRKKWNAMSNGWIVSFARHFIESKGISSKSELCKVDSGLYSILKKKNLISCLGLKDKKRPDRDWDAMSDEELVGYARQYMEDKSIHNKFELIKADRGLSEVLRRRGLYSAIQFEEKKRDWVSMNDVELIEHAKSFIEENGIAGIGELRRADLGLDRVLRERGLRESIGLESKVRNWSTMSDDEIVEYARKLIEKKDINTKRELQKTDPGLHEILRKRKLFGFLGYVVKTRRPRRKWRAMEDRELIRFARKFIQRKKITRKNELQTADKGLYDTLYRRGLIHQIDLENNLRYWKRMSDDEVIDYAERFRKTSGTISWKEFREGDPTLYGVLRERGLLDSFRFGATRKRNRDWASLSDEELVDYAGKFIVKNKILIKQGLRRADCGLYGILITRNLLDIVFSNQKVQQEMEGLQEISDALSEFGGEGCD